MTRLPLAALLISLVLSSGTTLPTSAADNEKAAAQLAKDLEPKRVTLKGDMTIAQALRAIHEKTGIEVIPPEDSGIPLKNLNYNNMPFWQVLDDLAKKADVRVALYGKESKIALSSDQNGYRELPVCYSGMFRLVLKRMVIVRDLETDQHYCLAKLEVAWEPRFQAFLMQVQPDSIEVQDDKGLTVEVPTVDRGQSPADGRIAMEVEVVLPALPRPRTHFKSVKGQLAVIGSPKLLTFTFDKLASKQDMEQEGVVVSMRSFRQSKEIWTVEMGMRYPAGGPAFESFQSWLINNQAYLLNKNGKRMDHAGYETDEQTATTASLRYRFTDDDEKQIKLGKAADWRFVYKTPAQISEVPIKFEFKDVPLP